MIVLGFEDFRKLATESNKRIYYYQDGNSLDLYYITEGIFVKSFIDLRTIMDKELFFSDKLFVGAIKLVFRIPEGDGTTRSQGITPELPSITDEYRAEEVDGGEDIQKKGVE